MISINKVFQDGVKFQIAVEPNAQTLGNQDNKISEDEFEKAKVDKTAVPHSHEYRCLECGHEWDQRVNHAPGVPDWPIPPCPKCDSKDIEQTA